MTLPPQTRSDHQTICPITHLYVDVLYVDQDLTRRQTLLNALRRFNVCAACCGSGGQALRWLSCQTQHIPALIVVHHDLSDMDFLALSTQINNARPTIPIYGIINAIGDQHLAACIKARMTAVFTASKSTAVMQREIVHYVEKQRQHQPPTLAALSFYPGRVVT